MSQSNYLVDLANREEECLTPEDWQHIDSDLERVCTFVCTSNQELTFIRQHHAEMSASLVLVAEIRRIRAHYSSLNDAFDQMKLLREYGQEGIVDEREIAEDLCSRGSVNANAIIVPVEGYLEPGSVCAICREELGTTCESPSIIKHVGCHCRGLQQYGKECLRLAFDYSDRCPCCRGNLEDRPDLSEVLQAMERIRVEFEAIQAEFDQEFRQRFACLDEFAEKLDRHHTKMILAKKDVLKLERAARAERRKETQAREVLSQCVVERSVPFEMFSQEHLLLMRRFLAAAVAPKYQWDAGNTGEVWVCLRNFIQICRSALYTMGSSPHSSCSRWIIEKLLEDAKNILGGRGVMGSTTTESLQEFNRHEMFRLQDLADDRAEIWRALSPETSKLTASHIKTIRHFHDGAVAAMVSDQVGHQGFLRPLLHGIRKMLTEGYEGGSTDLRYKGSGIVVDGLEALAESCVRDIVASEMLKNGQSSGENGHEVLWTEKELDKRWNDVFSVFRLEELLARYRVEKPEGWSVGDENVGMKKEEELNGEGVRMVDEDKSVDVKDEGEDNGLSGDVSDAMDEDLMEDVVYE